MNRFYVYEGQKPVGIIENADQMAIDDIDRLSRCLKLLFDRDIHLKPIYPGDFDFDPETGHKRDRIVGHAHIKKNPEKEVRTHVLSLLERERKVKK